MGGDVWFGYGYDGNPINGGFNYTNPIKGGYAWATMMHEIGHALGLKHGHAADTFPGGNTTVMAADRDSMEFSIMTYRSHVGAPTTGYINENWGFAQSFMMFDIAALQRMYGANYNTNFRQHVLCLLADDGEMFINGVGQGAPGGNRVFQTIWDGGGTDTYDFSNYATNESIDLRPGQWSVISATQIANLGNGNFARANVFNSLLFNNDLRSLIENAVGGSGNDTITGNQGANNLQGLGGSDSILGGTGNDTIFGGAGADRLFGEDNDDWLYYDGQDIVVNGGNGYDIAIRTDGQAPKASPWRPMASKNCAGTSAATPLSPSAISPAATSASPPRDGGVNNQLG